MGLEYAKFKFSYANSGESAIEKECHNYFLEYQALATVVSPREVAETVAFGVVTEIVPETG